MKKLIITKVLALLFSILNFSQNTINGFVFDVNSNEPISNVTIYDLDNKKTYYSNIDGSFRVDSNNINELTFFMNGYITKTIVIDSSKTNLNIYLSQNIEELNEVVVRANKKRIFQIKRMKDFEGTSIFAGKKNETIIMDISMANLASNNARQIYNQIPGLNIYQNDDAGLQLNIGGRGLDPNRTANFNTRQNSYDISADALGYPESYYTPPAEGIEEIQILRGAASLQYGTQFGGLINFIMRKPTDKSFELITRNTIGSNNLYTNFTSLSSSGKKIKYYGFFNYKNGNGFRDNSNFESKNTFQFIEFEINNSTKISTEITYLKYLAKQGGGLSDEMFDENPYQSIRSRNWFDVEWFLYNLKLEKKFNENSTFSFSFFGLEAKRKSIGYRSNRVAQIDTGVERDLIVGNFSNFGFETRLLRNYKILSKDSYALFGLKYYNSNSRSEQGPGTNMSDANFSFQNDIFPNYKSQSYYNYPNENIAFFGENIFYINDNFSITPGFRYENISTKSNGYYRKINLDNADNVIFNEKYEENDVKKRSFVLFGVGLSYKPNRYTEIYSNISENYRSVTFADISTINPAYAIDPEIDDEKGYSFDLGLRGNFKKQISYDTNIFVLLYEDRIGFVQKVFPDQNVKSEKGNVGNAMISGIESLFDFDLNEIFLKNNDFDFNYYINYSYINSKYLKSDEVGIEGNEVEFVPKHNLKTGIKFGYKNFTSNLQYSFVSEQFTDSSNAVKGNLSGVIGEIPAYGLLDFSISYKLKKISLESGVNNFLNEKYFTRRATGYPGPGIIPSPPRNIYLTLQLKL